MDDNTLYEALRAAYDRIQNLEFKVNNLSNLINSNYINTTYYIDEDTNKIEFERTMINNDKSKIVVELSVPKSRVKKWLLKKLFGVAVTLNK